MRCLFVIVTGFIITIATARAESPPDFNSDIAPLLAEHCLGCHSGPKPRGDLDLTRRATTLADGRVTPGKPANSSLWQRVADGEMPPKKPLPDAAKAKLRTWIAAGAVWGTDPIDPLRYTTATRAGFDWWSLQPVRRPSVPESDPATPHPIDAFIRARLRAKGLPSSPPADRRTLIRRLSFDLTGLPPTPSDVEAFLADRSPNAYERLVDRLLASPHYGERWARHWLDVVRFGESQGFERNDPRPTAWHFRDWVIRSLNADIPYDEFVRLQLAGDVLRPTDPDAITATGYLVAGVHNTVLPMQETAKQTARQDELEDLVGNVTQTFLGLTAHCARCHDHKFDPIPQADFYRLAAALSGVTHGERAVTSPDAARAVQVNRAEVERLDHALAEIDHRVRSAILARRAHRPATTALPPTPIAAWDFRDSTTKHSPKLTPSGKATFTPSGLALDGKSGFARSEPIGHDLREKTLEAWVRLDTLTQRGGGVFGIQTQDGEVFDTIVFGEQEPARWLAGSDHFRRTKSFSAPVETSAATEPVQIVITYAADGSVTGYRNGQPHGKPYPSAGPVAFRTGEFVAVFGIRHGTTASGNRMLAGTVQQARLYDQALTAAEVATAFATRDTVTETELVDAMPAAMRAERDTLRKQRMAAQTKWERSRAAADVKTFAVVPIQPPPTRLLVRGQVTEPAEVVRPGGVSVLRHVPADFGLAETAPEGDRRRKLAEWVAHPANPLFSRVMVNRLWHYHFGTGLVETPSDFGFNGGRPSHPELLDWLAAEFAARRYSLKAMHRLIVTSATYQQTSAPRVDGLAVDADTRLLWRKKPLRLEAEAVRDAMLSAAGLLNRTVGGKGFTDYTVTPNAGTTYYDPIDPVGPEFHRRSIYRFVPRGANPSLLEAFDCPDPAASAPRRTSTTTPLQALSLWNGPFALRMAETFAGRVAAEVPNDAGGQVDQAYRIAFQRAPTPDERDAVRRLIEAHGLRPLARALLNASEFLTVD